MGISKVKLLFSIHTLRAKESTEINITTSAVFQGTKAFGDAKQQQRNISEIWRECGKKGTLVHCWWECRLMQPLWKAVWRYLKKLKMELPYDPMIQLLEIYLEKHETLIQKYIRISMFTAAYLQLPRFGSNPNIHQQMSE